MDPVPPSWSPLLAAVARQALTAGFRRPVGPTTIKAAGAWLLSRCQEVKEFSPESPGLGSQNPDFIHSFIHSHAMQCLLEV